VRLAVGTVSPSILLEGLGAGWDCRRGGELGVSRRGSFGRVRQVCDRSLSVTLGSDVSR